MQSEEVCNQFNLMAVRINAMQSGVVRHLILAAASQAKANSRQRNLESPGVSRIDFVEDKASNDRNFIRSNNRVRPAVLIGCRAFA
jgi:hypothetical protein